MPKTHVSNVLLFSFTQSCDDFCKKWELEVRRNWPEFTFTSDEMTLTLSEPQATSGWMVEVECMKNTVRKNLFDCSYKTHFFYRLKKVKLTFGSMRLIC